MEDTENMAMAVKGSIVINTNKLSPCHSLNGCQKSDDDGHL